MIISLHTPKAGGSSFKALLENHFKHHFLGDYSDLPLNTRENERNRNAENFKLKFQIYTKHIYRFKKIECIHGHFLPYKYSSLLGKPEVRFITWFRDPLERLASHYYYWQRAYNKDTSGVLHKEVVENKWTFERFCFSEEMKNLYHQFLWKFPLENFSFIGIVEHFDEDTTYFAKEFLGLNDIVVPNMNVNPDKGIYFKDEVVIRELRKFHSIDYELYNTALNMRKRRIDD